MPSADTNTALDIFVFVYCTGAQNGKAKGSHSPQSV